MDLNHFCQLVSEKDRSRVTLAQLMAALQEVIDYAHDHHSGALTEDEVINLKVIRRRYNREGTRKEEPILYLSIMNQEFNRVMLKVYYRPTGKTLNVHHMY